MLAGCEVETNACSLDISDDWVSRTCSGLLVSSLSSPFSALCLLCSRISTANQSANSSNALTNKSTVKKWDCWICNTVNAEKSDASNPTRRPYICEAIKYRNKIANKSANAENSRPKTRKFV